MYNDPLHSSVCETLDRAVEIKASALVISWYSRQYLRLSVINEICDRYCNQLVVRLLTVDSDTAKTSQNMTKIFDFTLI